MRDLASRLGVSAGTLTHHFASREELALAAMDYVYALPPDWEEMKARSAPERLRRICASFVLSSPGRQRWSRFWIEYMSAAARIPELQRRQEDRFARQHQFFASLIADCLPEQRRPEAESEATRLIALANGLAMQQLAAPSRLSPDDARAVLDAHISSLVGDATPPLHLLPRKDGEAPGARGVDTLDGAS